MIQGLNGTNKKFYATRRRTILYLIQKYLNECGYPDIATTLKTEALLNEYELCDNIDIDMIYLEYCSYQQVKFGKIPNIIKKIPNDKTNLNEIKVKKSVKNIQKKVTELTRSFTLPLSSSSLSAMESLKESISIKQVDNQNLNKLINPIPYMTSTNYELPSDLKEFSDIIERTIITKEFKYKFKDIIGNEDAITTIKEAVILPLENPLLFSEDLKPWKSLLLYGPPGCGKTLIAKALSSEIQDISVPFFNITSSTIISKWRGDSEKILTAIFQMARNTAPSILFFDEIECLTGKRNSPNEHEASHRLKSEFLTLLDGIYDTNDNIFILANTNVPWSIDDAFLRRFEKKILIKLPSSNEREKLFNLYLDESKKWSYNSIEDIKRLSEGFTGDEIRIACKEYKMKCIRKLIENKSLNYKNNKGIGGGGGLSGNNKDGKIDAESLIDALKSMKPNSSKLYEKHFQWQQEIGTINGKN